MIVCRAWNLSQAKYRLRSMKSELLEVLMMMMMMMLAWLLRFYIFVVCRGVLALKRFVRKQDSGESGSLVQAT